MILEIFQIRLREIEEDLKHADTCLCLAPIVGWNIKEIHCIQNMASLLQAEFTEIIIKIAFIMMRSKENQKTLK
jgi:hypothetical protein